MTIHTQLSGKTALVTGASRGIGAETAKKLAAQGALVALHYGASKSAAEAVLADIVADGGKGFLVQGDLKSHADVEKLAIDVRAQLKARTGAETLDILVNNAGVAPFMSLEDTDEATFDSTFAVNVKAPFFLTARLVSAIPDGGRIIFLTTSVTKTHFPGITAYSASKGAIDVLIHHLAADYGPKGIRVNGVAPGAVNTDMSAWLASDEGQAQAKSMQALQTIGQPQHIADAVAFLAGPESDWITGTTITVSGGIKL
jgi:3-oxoacyl-[acyl-carrier protein] reductase